MLTVWVFRLCVSEFLLQSYYLAINCWEYLDQLISACMLIKEEEVFSLHILMVRHSGNGVKIVILCKEEFLRCWHFFLDHN